MPGRRFDPSEHVEYMPPEFTREQKMMYPEEGGDYSDFDKEGLPVNLSDDMIMRAHYLDLGMSHLLQKYRDGTLSDQEYIQFHRMNGELRSILQHIWSVGKRGLELWISGHLRGGNPAFNIGIRDLDGLLDTLQQLGLPARPAFTILERAIGGDMEDDLKRHAIGAPPLYDEYEYEDPDEQEAFDQALEESGFSDISEVEPTDDDIWSFLRERLENWEGAYGDETPMQKRKVTPWGVDPKNPESFLSGTDDSEEEFDSYHGGYVNDADWYQDSPHVQPFADIRSHPEYQGALDDEMASRWNWVNNMVAHRELMSELDMDDEEWAALDTQTQMALISRLMQAQHRTGNILTDYTPSFQFQSGRYEPRGDWVGWKMGDAPSLESNAVRKMLDDLNQSPMVESWDQMMEQFPHERWSSTIPSMLRMAASLDEKGQSDLADRIDEMVGDRIPAFRGVGPKGLAHPRRSDTGVYGPGYYLYRHPSDAKAYASPGGGILVGTVPPDARVEEDVVVLNGPEDFEIAGHVPTENTTDDEEILRLVREMGIEPPERRPRPPWTMGRDREVDRRRIREHREPIPTDVV